MTALVAVAVADGVQLTVTPTDAAVSRLDAGGLRVVRRPAGSPGTWIDYEAPLLGTVRYLAQDSAGEQATAQVAAAGIGPQLRRVFDPSQLVRPIVATMTAQTSLTATEHTIIGRADTIFTTYGVGKRRGSIQYACATYADTVALRKLYASGAAVLLRFPEYAAADLFHIGTTKADTPDSLAPVASVGTQQRWTVSVQYAEVEPSGLSTIAGWTLRDVDATYPSLGAAALAYATLGDVDNNAVVPL